jgi:hypothetical protein
MTSRAFVRASAIGRHGERGDSTRCDRDDLLDRASRSLAAGVAQKACFTDDTRFRTHSAKGRGLKCKPGEIAASPNKMAIKQVAHVVKGQLEVDWQQRYAGQTKARTVAAQITYPTRIGGRSSVLIADFASFVDCLHVRPASEAVGLEKLLLFGSTFPRSP